MPPSEATQTPRPAIAAGLRRAAQAGCGKDDQRTTGSHAENATALVHEAYLQAESAIGSTPITATSCRRRRRGHAANSDQRARQRRSWSTWRRPATCSASAKPGQLSKPTRTSCWSWMRPWMQFLSGRPAQGGTRETSLLRRSVRNKRRRETLGISRATASRYWTYARAWLINAIDGKSE